MFDILAKDWDIKPSLLLLLDQNLDELLLGYKMKSYMILKNNKNILPSLLKILCSAYTHVRRTIVPSPIMAQSKNLFYKTLIFMHN
jgi:hypothetical protein